MIEVLNQAELEAPAQVSYLNVASNGGPNPLTDNSDAAYRLFMADGDPRVLKPWKGRDGKTYIERSVWNDKKGAYEGKAFVANNTFAAFPRDALIEIDETIMTVSKPRMRAVGDLQASGLQYTIPNGYGKMQLQTQRVTDITGATVTMDGVTPVDSDRPAFDVQTMPLPVISKDLHFSLREMMGSRNSGMPLDTASIAMATERVAEMVEMITIGTVTGPTFGGGTVYGYTNFPGRVAGTLTFAPTSGSWTPLTTVKDVMAMVAALQNQFHYGPYRLYYGQPWNQYINQDYYVLAGASGATVSGLSTRTLKERLAAIDGISSVEQLDYIHTSTDFSLTLVSQNVKTVRMVVGMPITSMQWQTQGGLDLWYKIMCVMAPQLRVDIYGNSGIAVYTG